jgi:hypothetical protein
MHPAKQWVSVTLYLGKRQLNSEAKHSSPLSPAVNLQQVTRNAILGMTKN